MQTESPELPGLHRTPLLLSLRPRIYNYIDIYIYTNNISLSRLLQKLFVINNVLWSHLLCTFELMALRKNGTPASLRIACWDTNNINFETKVGISNLHQLINPFFMPEPSVFFCCCSIYKEIISHFKKWQVIICHCLNYNNNKTSVDGYYVSGEKRKVNISLIS